MTRQADQQDMAATGAPTRFSDESKTIRRARLLCHSPQWKSPLADVTYYGDLPSWAKGEGYEEETSSNGPFRISRLNYIVLEIRTA